MNQTSLAALLLAAAVALGAFGAHGLKDRLGEYVAVYEKAVFYHFIHALGLLIVSILPKLGVVGELRASRIGMLLIFGILVFGGSLYALAITKVRWLGAITPIGGSAFIVAWLWLAFSVGREQ